ncbi:hypothetical protein AB0F68_00100 [Micromonospora sp. NPDC023966]|uniref:hypothetical protein n=1 Tax=Micromonospora sp. NPDC023966 TaxID=3154699 RepID=UPI0033C2FA96
MTTANRALRRRTTKLWSRLYLAIATSIVGSETASDRLPATLMSVPNSYDSWLSARAVIGVVAGRVTTPSPMTSA